MALSQCRECAREVSTEAPRCPHCGVPNPTSRPSSARHPLSDAAFRRPSPAAGSKPSSAVGLASKGRRGDAPTTYVDASLLPGEAVLYRAKLHSIVLVPAVIFAVLAVLGLFGSGGVGLFFLILGAIAGVIGYLGLATSEFALTDRRVLAKVGWISRRSIELLLSKVESVAVEQSVGGRLFDYGTVVLTGTGGTREPFSTIASPFEFRKRVQAQLNALHE